MLIEKTQKGYRAWHTVRGGKIFHEGRTRLQAIKKMLSEVCSNKE